MKVKIIPGPRDEEKIRAIMNARETLSASEWEEFCSCCVSTHDDTWFDALYYACEDGDKALQEQEEYYLDSLLYGEEDFYAARMGGYDI